MGEILGITLSHFPYIRMKPHVLPSVLKGLINSRTWVGFPDNKDPGKWPEPMRKEWGDDQAETTGRLAQQHQIEQFRRVKQALDAFRPDFAVLLYRDLGEAWGPATGQPEDKRPKWWIHTQDEFKVRPFQIFGNRENVWEEDPDKLETFKLHKEGARYLVDALKEAGQNPVICTQADNKSKVGLGHNAVAGIVHMDWDRREFRMPVVPIGIEPFGFNRTRIPEGLGPWDKSQAPPLSPKEGFELGRTLARAIKASPWKVALVAPTNWSNSQNTNKDFGRFYPDIEADKKRFDEWKNNKFANWGDSWTWDEMEKSATWEVIASIVLAGAMTEVGAKVKHADMASYWTLNSTWVTTIFESK